MLLVLFVLLLLLLLDVGVVAVVNFVAVVGIVSFLVQFINILSDGSLSELDLLKFVKPRNYYNMYVCLMDALLNWTSRRMEMTCWKYI